ncbi:MAG: hypothetical protein ABJA93_00625 [Sporichthyaceae bacterium]
MTTANRERPETALPEPPTDEPDKPEGPIVAAILAGGIGCLVLGLLTTLSEASASFADKLKFKESVGPLSGKTTLTVVVWLLSWAILHAVYRNRPAETKKALTIALVLIGLGVLLTFPTFFQLFKPEE